ncbi:MAG: IclR family transcriptional regulator [Protaetiibacter sp.]
MPKSPIQSIDRAVAMLNVIAEAGRAGIVLSAVAAATGVHASTARTILNSLVVHGFVDQDAARRYRLGPAVFELNRRYAAQSDLASVAAPVIRRLWEESRETVHLAVLQGGRRVDLSVLVSPQLLNVNPMLGARAEMDDTAEESTYANSLFTTAAGKILLLTMSAEERAAHLAEIGAVVTPKGASSADSVLEQLAAVEEARIATNDEEEVLGVCGIAAPVVDDTGAIRAALCIGYPSVRKSPEYEARLRQLVVAAADELSTALGARTAGAALA